MREQTGRPSGGRPGFARQLQQHVSISWRIHRQDAATTTRHKRMAQGRLPGQNNKSNAPSNSSQIAHIAHPFELALVEALERIQIDCSGNLLRFGGD